MKIYLIYDTREEKFYTNGAKVAWRSKGNAKLSVLYKHGDFKRDTLKKHYHKNELTAEWLKENKSNTYMSIRFKDQTRYECREFDVDLDLMDSVIV